LSTSTKNEGFVITRWVVASCLIVSGIFDVGLFVALFWVEPSKRADVWWLFITVMVTFLIGDLFTFAYDKSTEKFKKETVVPVKFALFCLGVFVGAIFGEYVLKEIANAFNSLTPLAYVAFILLNFIPSFFLFLDFLNHEKAYRKNPKF